MKKMNEKLIKSLEEFINPLDSHKDAIVIGSTNLFLHGIDITPNDIDIILNNRTLEEIKEIHSRHVKTDIHYRRTSGTSDIARRMVLEINGTDIEVFEEDCSGLYRKFIEEGETIDKKFKGTEFRCLKLEAEKKNLQYYRT